ncbi:MAG: 3'-5' exonuclease [Lachnospiraceae bacterium]|nr:3'-5' exonuclease [Lachnospiraceae bacterium]
MSNLNATVIDLEMTGLNARTEKIIEIGAAKIRDGKVTKTYTKLLNPGRRLDDKTVEITGITDEMLTETPAFAQIKDEFLDFIGEDVLLGHNVIFDYSFLKKEIINESPKGTRFEKKGIDTLKIARRFLPGDQKKQLTALCEYYGIEYHAHRALDDALATFCLYEVLWETFYEKGPDVFEAKPLVYQVKKESPVMAKQIAQITRLLETYEVECPYILEKMTKNEASRYIDKLRTTHGGSQLS